jgi:transcriptional regulator GlxA family with amidase domain
VENPLDTIDWEIVALQCRGNVRMMAKSTFTSRRTLERYFQKKWGTSPGRWAKLTILERALALLRRGYANKEVVAELRLSSQSWLCREIKNRYSTTPRTFRPIGLGLNIHFDAFRQSLRLAPVCIDS